MTDKSYLEDIRIEPDALDIEWVRHPEKYMKWAEKAANAEDAVKLAKEALEVTDAKIEKEVRDDKTLEKITDSLIKNRVALHELHQEALKTYNDALYESNLYSVAVKAMEHRKSALENMVRLWAGSYFAGPTNARDLPKEMMIRDQKNLKARDDARKQTSKKMKDETKP